MEGMPLQLLISMLIIAMLAPILFSSLQTYQVSQVEMEVRQEIVRIINVAREVYLGGMGNIRTLEIELPSGPFCSLTSLSIGGGGAPSCYLVSYRLSTGERSSYLVKSPEFPICSYGTIGSATSEMTPTSLELSAGSYSLSISYSRVDIDIDGDGDGDAHVHIEVLDGT